MIFGNLEAQNFIMNPTPVNSCSGNFFDSGGSLSRYGNNEDIIKTICPAGSTGTHLEIQFLTTDFGPGDDLCIYDGANIAAPQIVCTADDIADQANGAFKVSASAPNTSGCLTFRFTSDGAGTGQGWESTLSCVPACQQVIAELVSSSPAAVPLDNGWIDICPGETVLFESQGLYPQNNFNYFQSDASSTFLWDFGDGTIGFGPDVTHTYQRSGGYTVQLLITDSQGCSNNNVISQRVRVATKPSFDFMADFPDEVCANDTLRFLNNITQANSFIQVTPNEGIFAVTSGNVDSIPLPDGVNVAYESPVVFNEFIPGAIITSPDQVESICINIEHSYVRDLDISIQCPNGSIMRLDTTNANFSIEVFLGMPFEGDDNDPNIGDPIPGKGFTYCFTPTPQFSTFFQEALMGGQGYTLPAGDYTPIDGFNTLVGCPVNGEWTLIVEDKIKQDNGWLFSWDITFSEDLRPDTETFTPAINSWGWVNNPAIIFQDQDSMLSVPGTAGTTNYIFEVVDEFGCTFDTTISFSVLSQADPRCFFCDEVVGSADDEGICEGEEVQLEVEYLGFDENSIPFGNSTPTEFGNATHPPSNPLETDIAVAGVSPGVITNPAMGIASVCIDIETDATGDLQIYLQAPSGEIVELTTNNGGSGDDFSNTCFKVDTNLPNITSAAPPYAGDFQPEGNWNNLIGAQVNGRWTLILSDGFGPIDINTLNSWSISFNTENIIEYSWTPSLGLSCNDCPDPIASPNASTEYIVRVADSFGCVGFDTILVSVVPDLDAPIVEVEDPAPGVLLYTWDPVPNASSYEVNVNNMGWFPPNNGTLSHFVNGLAEGDEVNFQVRGLTDIGSCNREETVVMVTYGECLLTVVPAVVREISCFAAADAAIAANVTNSIPPLIFTLDDAVTQSLSLFQNVGPGMHKIVVEDGDGCIDSVFFDLVEPVEIQIDAMATDVTCEGGNDGTLFASATGGVGDFDYLWATVPSTFDSVAINQIPGTYTVQATDANGCRTTNTATIGEPDPITVTLLGDEPSCNGGTDGSIISTVVGGTMPYSYEWDHGEFTPDVFVGAGNYTLTVRDANMCEGLSSVQITEPDPGMATAVGADASCHNTLDGSATIELVGTGPFTFAWDDPMAQTTQTAIDLAPGAYNFTLTDAAGCNSVGLVGIGSPSEVMASTSAQQTSCFEGDDGEATVDVAGGIMPYSYQWNDPLGQITQTAIGLTAGDYEVIITDGRGCSTTRPVTVDSASEIILSVDSTFASCIENPDGAASVFPIGGTGFYTYAWDDPMNQTTSNAEDLAVGIYTVTVTDSNMCSVTEDVEVIAGDPVRIDSIVATMPSCFGDNNGQLIGFISGGEAPYSYLWDDSNMQFLNPANSLFAGDYCLTVTDINGCTAERCVILNEPDLLEIELSAQQIDCFGAANGIVTAEVQGGTYPYSYTVNGQMATDSIFTGLGVGNYTIVVTDVNNCSAQEMIQIIEPMEALSIEIIQIDTSCFEAGMGALEVLVVGGTGPDYTFAWSDSDIPDAAIVDGLAAEFLTVTVTDENGCTLSDTITVFEYDPITINLAVAQPSCFGFEDGGIGIVDIEGGAGGGDVRNYTYSWEGFPEVTEEFLLNVPGGGIPYVVTVTDAVGCTVTGVDTLDQPRQISLDIEKSNPSCFGFTDGYIDIVSVASDSPVDTYLWSTMEVTPRIENLGQDNYFVTVTNEAGCESITSINLTEPPLLTAELVNTNNICSGDQDGEITAEVIGGTVPYDFDWSNGESGNPFISDLPDGMYSVVITDTNGCSITEETNLEAPVALRIDAEVVDITCFEGSDGSYTLNVTGGAEPYTYSRDGEFFGNQNIVAGLETGAYPVYVRDNRGCQWDSLIQIGTVPQFELFAGQDQFIEIGDTAKLDVVTFNAVGTPEIIWSSITDFDLSCTECESTMVSPIFTATYEAYGIDMNGCESNDFVTIFVSKTAQIMVPTGFTPNGDNNNDILIVHGKSKNIVRINEMNIYDRWGETVYQNTNFDINDTTTGWDGTFRGDEMEGGIYVWVLEVQFEDGSTDTFSGQTTLIR